MHRERSSFADLLVRHRLAAGLSQEELGGRAGLSPRTVSDLERGEHTNPRPATVRLLADALGLSEGERAVFLATAQGARSRPESESSDSQSMPAPMARDKRQDVANQEVSVTPSAIHTFLIVDVRGYTKFTLEHGDEQAARLASRLADLARAGVAARGGRVLELRGDEALAVFDSARQALRAAVELQARCVAALADEPALPLHVGIGLDAGEALAVEGGYRGAALNLAARLCSLAGAGETLASETVIGLARKVEGVSYEQREPATLKGFSEPVNVYRVVAAEATQTAQDERDQREQRDRSAPDDDGATGDASGANPAPAEPLPIGGFLGAAPDGPTVARDAEMGRLSAALTAVVAGAGRMVMLAGEAGAGKTRLAQELSVAARTQGFLVITGRCYEPQAAVAYFPFLEALHHALAQAPRAIRAALPERWPDVARLLPVRLDQGARLPETRGLGDDQQRLFWQVTSLVQALAHERPVALLLDDLHWADGASLDLLAHLARHTRGDRVLLLGVYRDVEVTRRHPLEGALRDLGRERLMERIAVRRLDAEGTRALIGAALATDVVSDEFTRLLHERAEGNPFFTGELLRELIERGAVYRGAEGRWERQEITAITIPEGVRAVIGQRTARLAPETQDALAEAAILGQSFAFEDLAGMSGRAEDDLDNALAEAASAGLIREDATRNINTYTFAHALIQQALLAELSTRRRRRLHRAAGEALDKLSGKERSARAAELAWHFAEADEPARAIPYALVAGDQAEAIYAHAEAERHFRMAAEMATDLDDQPHEALACEKLGNTLDTLARYAEARRALERANQLYRLLEDREGVWRTVAWLSDTFTLQECIERLRPALQEAEASAPSPATVKLLIAAAWEEYRATHNEQALGYATRALEQARTLGDPRLSREALSNQINCRALFLRPAAEVTIQYERLARDAENANDLGTLGLARNQLAHHYLICGKFGAALDNIEQSITVRSQFGDPESVAFGIMHRGYISYWAGDWSQAQQDCERVMEALRAIEGSTTTSALLTAQGGLMLGLGDMANATASLQQASANAVQRGDQEMPRKAGALLSEISLLKGDPEAARRLLEPLVQPDGLEELQSVFYMPQLAWAYVDLGEFERAEATLGHFIEAAREGGARLGLTEALRVRGMLEMRRGDEAAATVALEEALALSLAMPYPYGEVKTRYTFGQLERRRGQVAQAREHCARALAICDQLGERTYRRLIEQEGAETSGQESAHDVTWRHS